MAASRQLVVNRDGYIVDLETGEVVDESPLCYDERCEVPPVGSRDEWLRWVRVAPLPRGQRARGRSRLGAVDLRIKLPSDLAEKLNLAVLEGLGTKSELIRAALRAYLEGGVDYVARRGVTDSLLALSRLYAARGFLYAAQYMLKMARAYTDSKLLRQDLERAEEELEALLKHYNDAISELAKKLGLW